MRLPLPRDLICSLVVTSKSNFLKFTALRYSLKNFVNLSDFFKHCVTLLVRLKQTAYDIEDNFPCKLLKWKIDIFSDLLYPVFCSVILTLKFPDIRKTAFFIPFFKNDAMYSLKSYRPISPLATISIFFERNLFKQLNHSMRHRISTKQFGFQSDKSPILQLFTYFEQVFRKNSDYVFAIDLDYSEAFDKVPISIFFLRYITLVYMMSVFNFSNLTSPTATKL